MIKKLLFTVALVFASLNLTAQETKFGFTAGYLNVDVGSKYEGLSSSISESGFYLGALADIALSENFHLQPAMQYGFIEDSGIIFIPVMAKYYIGDSDFNIQAGPQASIITEETGDSINAFGLDLGLGAGYDINENFFVEARYALELTNRINGDISGVPNDVKSTINSLIVGVGYKF